MTPRPKKILICVNRRFDAGEPSCAARGSFAIAEAIEQGVSDRRIDIAVERFICLGQCTKGPAVKLAPGDFILGATPDRVPAILDDLEAACGVRDIADDGDGDGEPAAHFPGA